MTVLATVKAELGRNYKSAIRDAWMDGNYAARGLGNRASELQRIRNIFGPSWLVKAQPKTDSYTGAEAGIKPRYGVGDRVVLAKPYATSYVTAGPLAGERSYRSEAVVSEVLCKGCTGQNRYGLRFDGSAYGRWISARTRLPGWLTSLRQRATTARVGRTRTKRGSRRDRRIFSGLCRRRANKRSRHRPRARQGLQASAVAHRKTNQQ